MTVNVVKSRRRLDFFRNVAGCRPGDGSVKWPVRLALCPCVCSCVDTQPLCGEHAVRREGALPVCSQRAGAACSTEGQTPQPGRFSSSPHPLLLHPFALSCPLTPLAEWQAEEEGIYKSPQPPHLPRSSPPPRLSVAEARRGWRWCIAGLQCKL